MCNERRWQNAIDRARKLLEIYKSVPNGMFAAIMIQQSINLYEAGDRSQALLEDLENIAE